MYFFTIPAKEKDAVLLILKERYRDKDLELTIWLQGRGIEFDFWNWFSFKEPVVSSDDVDGVSWGSMKPNCCQRRRLGVVRVAAGLDAVVEAVEDELAATAQARPLGRCWGAV